MELRQKERLVGAAVLVIIAVIFIPMLLDESQEDDIVITETNIPAKPETMPVTPEASDFSSRIVPLQAADEKQQSEMNNEETPQVATEATSEAPVKIEPTTPIVENTDPQTDIGVSAWVVQLGSFSSKANAESLNEKMRKAGFRSFVQPIKENNTTQYRVRVGPELRRSDADALKKKLATDMKMDGIVVQYP